jgi:Outer membrane protein beta-barrel domain
MKKLSIALTCFLGTVCSTTFAEENSWYTEAAYVAANAAGTTYTFTPGLVRFTLGKVVADNWAIEGLLTQGVTSSSVAYSSSVNIQVNGNSGYGFAVRPFMKVTDDVELYGRVGWMQSNLTSKVILASSGATYSSTDYSWSQYMGSIGVAYKISKNFNATLDYSTFTQRDDVTTTQTAVGVRYNF